MKTQQVRIKEIVISLTDRAQELGADPNDDQRIIRDLITRRTNLPAEVHFPVWLCVCCELADREAQAEGYDNQVHRALAKAKAITEERRT